MNYKFHIEQVNEQLTLGKLEDGELAIVTEGEFSGELFYKNVIGLHGISGNRYWPSEYARHNTGRALSGWYNGPLEVSCRRVVVGDVLKVLSAS